MRTKDHTEWAATIGANVLKASVGYEEISAPLARQIITHKWQLSDEDEVKKIKSDVETGNRTNIKEKSKDLLE